MSLVYNMPFVKSSKSTPEIKVSDIYGVLWDGTSTTQWERTDDAILFSNPTPYESGMTADECNSPFDNIMPWAGMTVSERTGGTMVAIPKFWYLLEQIASLDSENSGLSIKISNHEIEGYHVSPAHMDRGDGNGERDIVYVARYHCGSSACKSMAGVTPKVDITRNTARYTIHLQGDNIWQFDFATRFTIQLLYLVEFANWDSQSVIGGGCSTDGNVMTMGYTDSMPYHTGTMQSRSGYGQTQYRNIEGLWDNVYDWCDGCYYNSRGLNLILNPSNFSDSDNGVLVGKLSNGYPTIFSVSSSGGYPMFYPYESISTNSPEACDYWGADISTPYLCVGGHYLQCSDRGLFFVNYGSVFGDRSDVIGTRIIELP